MLIGMDPMSERFSDEAQQILERAEEAARGLGHKHVGTEHLLLGLLADERLVSARALSAFGLTYEGARSQVVAKVGTGHEPTEGEIPFTPQSQKALELSMRESLRLGHDYIGSGHLLLGLGHGKDTLSSQILRPAGADLRALRECTEPLIPPTEMPLPAGAAAQANPELSAVAFTIAPDAQLTNLLMLAGGRALADARREIGVGDVVAALWDDPDARQLLVGRRVPDLS
jgi:ATP-dependent Clp protease ATP-binding subunit ClpC